MNTRTIGLSSEPVINTKIKPKSKQTANSKDLPRTDFISFIYDSLSLSIRLVFYITCYYDDDDDDDEEIF